jgi:hypothetical protein
MSKKLSLASIPLFFILVCCGSNKNLVIDNRLNSCLNKEELELIIEHKRNKKKNNLYITEVAFNFEECLGLFRYDFAQAYRSAGMSNYVLKGRNNLYFQSEDVNVNKKILKEYMESYGMFFSEIDKKYVLSLFTEIGVTHGLFSQ